MAFTLLFISLLLMEFLIKSGLSLRQVRHVLAHYDAVPPAFAAAISLYSHQRAARYTVAKHRMKRLEWAVDAALLLGLTVFGGLQFLNALTAQHLAHDGLRQLALIALLTALIQLIHLPFSWWRHFRLDAHFGFNRMTQRTFWLDQLKGGLLGMAIGLPILGGLLWLMAKGGGFWWGWAWLLWSGVVFSLVWVYPKWIAPCFNRFEPLDDAALTRRIEALAERTGFALDALYVMDGSSRSAHANAYLTGLGRNKRIVFFDTLLSKLSADQIEAVLAHELGHFHFGHIRQRIIGQLLLAGLAFALLGWLHAQAWFYTGLGVLPLAGRPNDALALILFMLALPRLSFYLQPLLNHWSRRHEYQADAYAAEHSSAKHLLEALLRLYDGNANTLTPDPLHTAFYDSHPPAARRVQALQPLVPPPSPELQT
ncbi:MAG: M48 family metallopeptidase [Pigmentiphaga sp.]